MSPLLKDILDKCKTVEEVEAYLERGIVQCDSIINKVQRTRDRYEKALVIVREKEDK